MVGEAEGKTLSYGEYKRIVWGRMRNWWTEHGRDHPERAGFISERIAVCDRQLDLHRDTP